MFHLECFRCAACRRHLGQYQLLCQSCQYCTLARAGYFFLAIFCSRSLFLLLFNPIPLPVPGDEFALHGEGIYCKEDHELLERCEDNNNLEPKHAPGLASPRHIKTELEDFRDSLSDLGREEDSYR